jgi:hypothetical protein
MHVRKSIETALDKLLQKILPLPSTPPEPAVEIEELSNSSEMDIDTLLGLLEGPTPGSR